VELSGRSAIVTGGAGGLGAATVRRLTEAGLGVVVFDQNADGSEKLVGELSRGAAVSGDVTSEADVAGAIAAAEAMGPLGVVVNVAGGATGGGRTLSRDNSPHSMEVFTSTMAMNAFGTFNVTRLAASAMAANEPDENGQRGVVVNTASIAGLEGQAGQVAYGAAKAAILGMTLPIARDLAPVGIRVCAIAPGTMGTPIMMSVNDEMKEKLTSSIQFPKRMGKPEEFAQLVLSIVENAYLNGENIRLDGALRFPPK
jgi:NAD(P)-dependent dehydrogenase (short-subunit alcohol dehydrogenase family)